MATNNRIAWTDSLSLPVADGTDSGDPVLVGSLPGVALTNKATEANPVPGTKLGNATVAFDGVFDLPVTGAVASAGLPVYITSGGTLTATSTSNTLFGYSVPGVTADGSKGTGTGPLSVKIAKV
jgi:predicted RecA/RadA family phage recombinase